MCEQHPLQCDVFQPHIDSFNYLLGDGLRRMVADGLEWERFRAEGGEAVELRIAAATIAKPCHASDRRGRGSMVRLDVGLPLLPSECRQRRLTYAGQIGVTLEIRVNGRPYENVDRVVGAMPIMLQSDACHLKGSSGERLVKLGEEPAEKGGYYVVNGSEKVIRSLVMTRRNFPLALKKDRYKDRGPLYSEFAIQIRSVRDNYDANLTFLHYLENGSIMVCLIYKKQTFFLPLIYIMKGLADLPDTELYSILTRGKEKNAFWCGCVLNMLQMAMEDGIVSRDNALDIIGKRFRIVLADRIAPWESHADAAEFLLRRTVCINLDNNMDKLYSLAFAAQKLIALVKNEILTESADNPQFQETGLSGHIMLMLLKERLEIWQSRIKYNLRRQAQRKAGTFELSPTELLRAVQSVSDELSRAMAYFLATGNLVSVSGMAMPQTTGYAVIAERINHLRYVSHFRALHRGSFFTEMRTTDVRKLAAEAWGFICPVHTPDGGPCGLLNHITASCHLIGSRPNCDRIEATCSSLGVVLHNEVALVWPNGVQEYEDPRNAPLPVYLNGKWIGFVRISDVEDIQSKLRKIKVDPNDHRLPTTCEITLIGRSVSPDSYRSQAPALYLMGESARMVRPVKNLLVDHIEWIGSFEQVYMSIALDADEMEISPGLEKAAKPETIVHQELHPSALFSFAANLIPLPDHNQSPRNVYQCQMGKQTMGTPIYAWTTRTDNKMYRILTPQRPLVKTAAYDLYAMDDYPLGTNAIVAVISYSGYDMEDAMVINRGSYERGFCHGHIVKNERVNLRDGGRANLYQEFSRDPSKPRLVKYIDADGLPHPGQLYQENDPYLCVYDAETGRYNVKSYKGAESAVAAYVRVVTAPESSEPPFHAIVQWRLKRNPIIGDKFASRHGQKGINSFLWPVESMPFTETGMVPDILFNPHGYPSRMTIGMMIESMAGKAASCFAADMSASPFLFGDDRPAIKYYGDLLEKAGYSYLGQELMYSGITGSPFEVQIFTGVVYYQRLRHMVADKFQVRAKGPVDPLTQQPVKGRKRAGGIRFGEMERDAIMAHGCAFMLTDRLMNSSDCSLVSMCKACGSMLSATRAPADEQAQTAHKSDKLCSLCASARHTCIVRVPYILRYLATELASVNIKLSLAFDSV